MQRRRRPVDPTQFPIVPITDSDIRALEEHLLRGWPPARLVGVRGWRCALDRGVTRRPNSVWPLAWEGEAPLADATAEVETLCRRAGLRPCFKITRAAQPRALDEALAALGYATEGRSHVLVAEATRCSARLDPGAEVVLLEQPSEAWLACYWAERTSAAERAALGGLIERMAAPRAFGASLIDGAVASVALAVASDGWTQLSAVRTTPALRRRGLAAAVMAALAAWAKAAGAGRLALQVAVDNTDALGLYRNAGFRRAYEYHYRAMPR